LKLLLDEDLSPEIAKRLRASGVDAISVHEIGRRGLPDREQLEFAATDNRCIVTRNRNDFILLTREFFDRGKPHRGVLVVSWKLPPDNFGRIATAVRDYLERFGDGPSDFLFDFVSG
jgi:predicted nuclease of predicted toxin-antitoxin system